MPVFFRNYRAGRRPWTTPCSVEQCCQGLVDEVWSRGDVRYPVFFPVALGNALGFSVAFIVDK